MARPRWCPRPFLLPAALRAALRVAQTGARGRSPHPLQSPQGPAVGRCFQPLGGWFLAGAPLPRPPPSTRRERGDSGCLERCVFTLASHILTCPPLCQPKFSASLKTSTSADSSSDIQEEGPGWGSPPWRRGNGAGRSLPWLAGICTHTWASCLSLCSGHRVTSDCRVYGHK